MNERIVLEETRGAFMVSSTPDVPLIKLAYTFRVLSLSRSLDYTRSPVRGTFVLLPSATCGWRLLECPLRTLSGASRVGSELARGSIARGHGGYF